MGWGGWQHIVRVAGWPLAQWVDLGSPLRCVLPVKVFFNDTDIFALFVYAVFLQS